MNKYCEWRPTDISIHNCRTSCGKFEIISYDSSSKVFKHDGEKCPDCGKVIKLVS